MDLLQELMNALGPSGDEKPVRELIKTNIKKYVKEVYTDKFGNLIAHKSGKGKKIMLVAHMDEIGLMVNEISSEGKIYFSSIGYVEPLTVAGETVFIVTKNHKHINGIVTCKGLHEGSEIFKVPEIDRMYVDTGLTRSELTKKGVEIGCYIVPTHLSRHLGKESIICGKALDDRLGCCILVELAKKLKKVKGDVYFVFTVQEEVGLYGAKVSVYNINPDWGIAVDVTVATDSRSEGGTRMGYGPTITVKDAEMISNRDLNNHIRNIAKKYRIPIQFEVVEVGTTDATNIMLSRRGVPSTVVAIPVRNIHSTIGVADRTDVDNAIRLLIKVIQNPPKNV